MSTEEQTHQQDRPAEQVPSAQQKPSPSKKGPSTSDRTLLLLAALVLTMAVGWVSTKDKAMWLAVDRGYPTLVKVLKWAGADPNRRDENGRTPLGRAAVLGDLAAVETLLSVGTNVDSRDGRGGAQNHDPRHLVTTRRAAAGRGDGRRRVPGLPRV